MADFPLPEQSIDPSEPAMPEVSEPIIIPLDQADLAGLTGSQPGDVVTVSLRVVGNDENGIQVEVAPPEPAEGELPPEEPPVGMISRSKVRGPSDLGV